MRTPDHYDFQIQPVEYIMRNGLGFCEGNVVKYVSRWKLKNGRQDLEKARHYIDILLQNLDDDSRKPLDTDYSTEYNNNN